VHATALILDIHHLPLFARGLRARACRRSPAPAARTSDPSGASVVPSARALLRKIGAADVHLLVTTPDATGAVGRHRPASGAAASVRDVLDEVVDLALVVGATKPAPDRPRHFPARLTRSGDPLVPATGDIAWASWEELLAPIRPPLTWAERLQLACPRVDAPPPLEPRGNPATWVDATQEEFARRATDRGWTVEVASPEQDQREHWDLRIRRGAEDYRVDVKARSRVRRGDAEPQDDWHWVELRGIVDDGWLLGGQADLIAFRTAVSFVLVRRADLIAHVVHHVDPADVVDDPRAAVYRVYHRTDGAGRESLRPTGADRGVLTLVPTNRLRQLAWDAWGEGSADAGGAHKGLAVSAPA
jgi:hypothetical protein